VILNDSQAGGWEGDLPLTGLSFDPLMRNARVKGTVQNCAFDVTWTASGIGHYENTSITPNTDPAWIGVSSSKFALLNSNEATATITNLLGVGRERGEQDA
jgi:hypothetical protein